MYTQAGILYMYVYVYIQYNICIYTIVYYFDPIYIYIVGICSVYSYINVSRQVVNKNGF